jgi:P-type E1-E2 ATPase
LIGGYSIQEFWTLLASGEANSEHVIAKALVSHAQEKIAGLHVLPTTNFEITPGFGLSCIVGDGQQVAIGNRQWILQNYGDGAIDPTHDRMAAEMEVRGHTVIWMAVNGSLAGFVAMSDTIRPEAVATVQALLDRGYNVWLLSGDNVNTCRAVAQDLGLDPDRVIGGVLPGGKREIIQQLQGQSVKSSAATPLKNVPAGCVVAMVGDGINDSPALSQADVGIAIGSGTDIAVESAQVVLLKDQLWDVVIALDLARKTFQVIRSNFLWAFLYNLIGIPLASGFLYPFTGFVVPPAVAGASEMLSSLPVVLFSLALKLYRPPTLKIPGIRA